MKNLHDWVTTATVKTRCGKFAFEGGYPTKSATALQEQLKLNRAIDFSATREGPELHGERRHGHDPDGELAPEPRVRE